MNFGTVVSFSPETGHGMIAPDNGSHPVFVSRSAIAAAGLGQLAERQRVGFDVLAADSTAPVAVNLWTTWSGR